MKLQPLAGVPERTLGWGVLRWCQDYLVHGPGDLAGQPLTFSLDAARFIVWAYTLMPDGRRQFFRACHSRPKGCAKTEMAGALVHAELSGPVRFDHWDEDDPGVAVGRPVQSPSIPMFATSAEQSEETIYGAFRQMAGPELEPSLDIGLTRTNLRNGDGRAVLVSSSSASRDGGRPTFSVEDETHLWASPELRKLHNVIQNNLRKRIIADPWGLETTTAYAPGEDSVAEGTRAYAERVAAGEIKDERLLYDHREADKALDLRREDHLRAAIVQARGDAATFANIDAIVSGFHDPQQDEATFRRYWLNQVVKPITSWMESDIWDSLEDRTQVVARREPIALGFDGGRSDDSTALIGCRLSDGYLFLIAVWEKPEGAKRGEWRIDEEEVETEIQSAFQRYEVVRFYVDPPYWESNRDGWRARWGSVVVDFWTHHETRMAQAVRRLHTDAVAVRFHHDGNPILRKHVLNCRKRKTRGGDVLDTPRDKDRVHKIDAATAAVLAWEARADAVATGWRKRSKVPVSG